MTGATNGCVSDTLPIVIVHGGAWRIPDTLLQPSLDGVKQAALAARASLTNGKNGGALRAVEAAVRVLEDDPVFDAGKGSCLTRAGTVEMDAAAMVANSGHKRVLLGGVACISNARNPISVASHVLRADDHVLYVGAGADQYAERQGLADVQCADDLVTDAMRAELRDFESTYDNVVHNLFNGTAHDTVGCVVVDACGNIACATSTGGITAKHEGRVGDSPLAGSGLYCATDVAGVSATGHGESISKAVLCKHILDLMQMKGERIDHAVHDALMYMKDVSGGGCGGVVAADAKGRYSAQCTTERMAWACVTAAGVVRGGVERGEDNVLGYM